MSFVDHAQSARRARFVGRRPELDAFRAALADAASSVLWVFGPGGVGKSTFLAACADTARDASRPVHVVDLRAVDPTSAAVIEAIEADTKSEAADQRPVVVVLDSAERIAGLEGWLRTSILPLLAAGSVVVVGSRHPPSLEWRLDPALSPVLHVVPLRNLTASETAELLTKVGLPGALHADAYRLAGGHPLALILLAQVVGRPGSAGRLPTELADAPDVVADLLSRLLDDVRGSEHRRVLEAAALARVTTRGLLRSLFGASRAAALFDWLRKQPFVESVPGGLSPHELAREALEADLRGNDPDAYAELHHAIRAHALTQLGTPGRTDATIRDVIFLHRGSSAMSGYWDWTVFGAVTANGFRPEDHGDLEQMTRDHLGPEVAGVLRYWLDRAPERFTVVRSADGNILGYFAILVVDQPTPEDLDADVALAALWGHAGRNDPLRPGQVLGITRFLLDRAEGQGPSATFGALTSATLHHWLTTRGLAWDYITGAVDEAYWTPLMTYLDYHRLRAGDHCLGATEFVAYAHDWRRLGPAEWLDLMEARELGGHVPAAPPVAEPTEVALDRSAFDEAVRSALRDLPRPDRLATNPLLRSRMLREVSPSSDPAGLDHALRTAVAELPDVPRTAKARRAVERTFLHGAVTQEAAAEVLDLPFSTYRRHLAAGIAMVAEVLWRWEVYGRES
jgi:hypothetical protein